MTDHRPFTRRFRELISGESQFDVAQRLGYTQGRVSHFARGEKPSRAFVEKLVEVYGLNREEWLTLAGFREEEDAAAPVGDDTQRIAAAVADLLRGEGTLTPRQRLAVGLADRAEEWGRAIPVDFYRGLSAVTTYEQADAILRDLDRQHAEGLL